MTQPKQLNVHTAMDLFAAFVQSNTEFCAVTVQNKLRLIEWYKQERDERLRSTTRMFDELIKNAEQELTEVRAHADFFGLQLAIEDPEPPLMPPQRLRPQLPTDESEGANG